MTRKKRVFVPIRRGGGPTPDPRAGVAPRTAISIDTTAALGRSDLGVGHRVRINGTGRFAGETGVIVRLVGSVIPSAVVRTDTGATGQVRTIDLQPLRDASA